VNTASARLREIMGDEAYSKLLSGEHLLMFAYRCTLDNGGVVIERANMCPKSDFGEDQDKRLGTIVSKTFDEMSDNFKHALWSARQLVPPEFPPTFISAFFVFSKMQDSGRGLYSVEVVINPFLAGLPEIHKIVKLVGSRLIDEVTK